MHTERAIAGLLMAVALLGCGGGGNRAGSPGRPPPTPIDRSALESRAITLSPVLPGTYRWTGTRVDSRHAGQVVPLLETHVVQSAITANGEVQQTTAASSSDGSAAQIVSVYRGDGVYRIHESTGSASWDWVPALRGTALPLRLGLSWTDASTATILRVDGARRTTSVMATSIVSDTDELAVNGVQIAVFIIDGTTRTTVTDTNLATGAVTSFVDEDSGRSWFSPEFSLDVRSSGTTTVRGRDPQGRGDYVLTSNLQLDRL